MFKKIIGYIITFGAGIAAILAGLAINKRRGLDDGTVDDLRQLGEGQRNLDAIAKSDARTIRQARKELDRAKKSASHSAGDICRAKDIIAELRKRKTNSGDSNGGD